MKGFGTLMEKDKKFKGEFQNDEKNGYGEEVYSLNDKALKVYKGRFVDNKPLGQGILTLLSENGKEEEEKHIG